LLVAEMVRKGRNDVHEFVRLRQSEIIAALSEAAG
jgi:hypothetical protein